MNANLNAKVHIGASDSVNYYNQFLKRYDDSTNSILVSEPAAAESSSLFVIDVQDDFILPPPGLPFDDPGYIYGRFNVEDGAKMTKELGAFIVANMNKFTKVVFSRDTHTVDHCSFGTSAGPFPNHCVANHVGSKMHDDMKLPAIMKGSNVEVIFKGCAQTTDSFGAVPYSTKDADTKKYSERRQLGKCTLDGFTGGKYLKDITKNFEDYPFTGIPKYTQVDEKLCAESSAEKIAAELGDAFQLQSLIPEGQTSGSHNIYVVGVAGDYCVKDTAMNIMNSLPENKMLNGVTVNVYILQPFVRYGFLPIQYLGGFNNVYKNAPAVQRANYSNMRKDKDINQYVFKYDGENKVALTKEEIVEKKDYIDKILSFKNALTKYNFAGDKVLNALGNAGKSNPEVLCSFLSPVKDIIADYKKAGVKMLLTTPSTFTMGNVTGGRYSKTRKSRKSKKARRSRKH